MRRLLSPFFSLSTLAAVIWITGAATVPEPSLLDASGVAVDATNVVEIWKAECASCHGNDGRGETRAGKRAGVKDFTDAEYQSSWTDEEAVEVIKTAEKDGKALRNKNPFADKLSDDEIGALVAYVRAFAE